MQTSSSENLWIQRTKWLTQALILSGALNIGLVATFVYFTLKEKQHSLAIEGKPFSQGALLQVQDTNAALLRSYSLLPFQELLLRMENKELAEEGLSKRDISLACLVAFHHFNLEKALGGTIPQKRIIPFSNAEGHETIGVPVFPGLADEQFQAIVHYAKTEKWPLTAQGLFYEIQRAGTAVDPSLLDAFFLTSEFHAVFTLFQKTGSRFTSEQIAALLCEGDWKTLSTYALQQRMALDLSSDRRSAFLTDYLDLHSVTAAKWLLETGAEFASKRLSDAQVLALLDLHAEKSPLLETFCKELLSSPRTDAVCKRAAATLYQIAEEVIPEPYDHAVALQRFLPKTVTPPVIAVIQTALPEASPAKAKKRYHTVQSGENLWKIARKYQVRVDEIMRINHLETEKLRPGKQLEIPSNQK